MTAEDQASIQVQLIEEAIGSAVRKTEEIKREPASTEASDRSPVSVSRIKKEPGVVESTSGNTMY